VTDTNDGNEGRAGKVKKAQRGGADSCGVGENSLFSQGARYYRAVLEWTHPCACLPEGKTIWLRSEPQRDVKKTEDQLHESSTHLRSQIRVEWVVADIDRTKRSVRLSLQKWIRNKSVTESAERKNKRIVSGVPLGACKKRNRGIQGDHLPQEIKQRWHLRCIADHINWGLRGKKQTRT